MHRHYADLTRIAREILDAMQFEDGARTLERIATDLNEQEEYAMALEANLLKAYAAKTADLESQLAAAKASGKDSDDLAQEQSAITALNLGPDGLPLPPTPVVQTAPTPGT